MIINQLLSSLSTAMNIRSILVFCCMNLLFGSLAGAEHRPIKLGVIAPLSGEVATWGNDVKNVISYVLNQQNVKDVTVIFEDDLCLGKNAVTAAHKLIEIDKIDYAMVICTESTLAVAPIFERAKIIVISPAAGGAAVSDSGDYIFRTWPSSAATGKLLANYVSSRHRTIGMLSEDRGYPQELASSFMGALPNGKIEAISEMFQSDETDFRSILNRFQAQKVGGLFINTNAERAFAAILTQIHQLKWNVPIYGVYMPGNSSFLQLAGELANGIVFVAAPSAESSFTPEGKNLYSGFVSKFGELRSSTFVFGATVEALQRVLSLRASKEDARRQLYNGHFNGVFGEYSFDRNGDIVGIEHQIRVIKDGKSAQLQ